VGLCWELGKHLLVGRKNVFVGKKVLEKNLNKHLPIVLYQLLGNPFFSLSGGSSAYYFLSAHYIG
jgi:hypothetical protein